MTEAASQYCVILKQPKAPDFMVVAKALAAIRKTPQQDQVMAAKGSWGIIAEHLGSSEAATLVEGLASAGIESRAVADSALFSLPPAQPLNRFEPAAAQGLALIAAAGISVTHTTTKTVKEGPSAAQKILSTGILLATGLPIKIGGKDRMVEKTQHTSDLLFYVDLLYKNPSRRLRIDAQHFDYSFLKEKKLYFLQGNFKLLLGELAAAAPEAWRNRGAQILIEGKPIPTMGYESLADLERESRWLMTIHGQV